MIELTSEMIIEIHNTIIHRYGGLPGILCKGTIDYLVARINNEPESGDPVARYCRFAGCFSSISTKRWTEIRSGLSWKKTSPASSSP
jgi:hypothetical protein